MSEENVSTNQSTFEPSTSNLSASVSDNAAEAPRDDLVREAAETYLARYYRFEHPRGSFDKAGRWYPSRAECCPECGNIRSPSKAYPYSLMLHCRTLKHVSHLFRVDQAEVRKLAKKIETWFLFHTCPYKIESVNASLAWLQSQIEPFIREMDQAQWVEKAPEFLARTTELIEAFEWGEVSKKHTLMVSACALHAVVSNAAPAETVKERINSVTSEFSKIIASEKAMPG